MHDVHPGIPHGLAYVMLRLTGQKRKGKKKGKRGETLEKLSLGRVAVEN